MVGGEQATPFPRVPSPPPSTHPPPGFSSTPPPASSPIHIPARGVVHPGDTIFDLSGMDTVRLVDRETHTEPEMNSTADETTPLLNTISSLSSSIAGMRSSKPMPVPTLDNRLNPYGNAQIVERLFSGGEKQHYQYLHWTQESLEKMQQLKKKKEKRAKKARERNVKEVKRAEEVEGYEGEKELADILHGLGENSGEDKLKKIRKTKDFKEKKERKRKSVEKCAEDESEDEKDEEEEEEKKKVVKENEGKRASKKKIGSKNEKIKDSLKNPVLVNIQETSKPFTLFADGLGPRSRNNSEQSTESSFVQVKGKKNRGRRGKEEEENKEESRQKNGGGGNREIRRTSNYSLRSREVPVVIDHDNKDPSWAQEHQPRTSEHHSRAQPGVQSKAKLSTPPPTLPDTRKEFPTLDIAQDFPALLPSSLPEVILPSAWVKTPTIPRDTKAVINPFPLLSEQAPVLSEQAPILLEKTKLIPEKISGQSGETFNNCDKNMKGVNKSAPVSAQVKVSENGSTDKCKKVKSGLTEIVEPAINNIGAGASVVITNVDRAPESKVEKAPGSCVDGEVAPSSTDQDNFEFDTRNNPVVLGAEFQEESTEISFGFDVNEELVSLSMAGESTIPSTPLQSGYTTPVPEPVTASYTTVANASTSYVPAPIESYDGAILCYGALEGGYVSTEAGLVSISASPPFGLINGVGIQNSGIPPPFPAHLVSQINPEMVNTDMAEDQEAETAAVSPESGISSASPLSWQVEDNIGGEDRSSSSPVLLQPGSYPRKNKKKGASIMEQVNSSLENWSRHSTPEPAYRGSPTAWQLSRIDDSVAEDSGLGLADDSVVTSHVVKPAAGTANYPEIVGFLQKNWNKAAQDKKIKIYQGE